MIIRRISIALTAVALLASCGTKKATAGYEVDVPDPEDAVIYQVNPRLYAPENSFRAVIEQLDSIKAIGANVVWVMPIYPIGKEKSKNSPYSIADYMAVNPEFGSLEDFKALVEGCHERGMAIILDWVANHTAWDNVWLKEHPDWYTQDSLGNIIYPPNTDWTDVADLNYDNQDMRQAMTSSMLYWVKDVGVDGFRCDVADEVPADFWKDAISQIRASVSRPILMLAEGNRPETFAGGFDMNYAWDYMNAMRDVFCRDSSATKLIRADADEYSVIPAGKVKLRFTTNHDEATKKSTVNEFGGKEGALAAYVAAIYTHGAALIYGEQEVAYPDTINFFKYQKVDWTANNDVRQEYKKLLRIFNENPVLHGGGLVSATTDDVLMYTKADGNLGYLVAVNVRNTPREASVPQDWKGGSVTDLLTGESIKLTETLSLTPFEYRILKK